MYFMHFSIQAKLHSSFIFSFFSTPLSIWFVVCLFVSAPSWCQELVAVLFVFYIQPILDDAGCSFDLLPHVATCLSMASWLSVVVHARTWVLAGPRQDAPLPRDSGKVGPGCVPQTVSFFSFDLKIPSGNDGFSKKIV